MFLTNVLLKKAKSKAIMVVMESVISGHKRTAVRERLGDKLEFVVYDPYNATALSVRLEKFFLVSSCNGMHKCFKYLGSLNLISLADQLMGNVLATGDKSTAEVDRDFFQIYKWTSLPAGFHEARKTGKPIFVFIQRSTCPACKHLKSKFVKSLKLSELSSRFVMVNVDNGPDSVRNRGVFHPDGKYVPRILFFTPEGRLLREAYNRHARDPKYKYFYSNPSHVIETMLMVLQILGAFPPNVDQPPDIANQSGTPSKTPAEDDFHTPTVLDQ